MRLKLSQEKVDPHPFRTLAIFLGSGIGMFVLGLSVLLLVLASYTSFRVDSTTLYFYVLVGGAGGLFGFERWMYYESGGVNPFHDN